MFRKLLVLSALGGISMPLFGAEAATDDLNPQAVVFGARETVDAVDISPDGSKIVYIAPGNGASSVVMVARLRDGDLQPVLSSSGKPDRVSWCNFESDARLICQNRALLDYEGLLVGFSRLYSVSIDGKDVKELGQDDSPYNETIRQSDGAIMDWLPDEDGAVLMSRTYVPEAGRLNTRLVRKKDGLGVDRIDVVTLKATAVEQASQGIDAFMSDGRGHVRMRRWQSVRGATGQLRPEFRYQYRPTGASGWEEFATYNIETNEGMYPIAIDAELDAAYVLKKLNGRDALYRVKLDGSMSTELVYANDKVDVDNVVRIGHGARVIGVTFAEEKREVVYFDPEYSKLSKALAKAIPNLPLVHFAGSSKDNGKLLIFAGSDADAGRYYTYDKRTRVLNELMLVRPKLEHASLAKMTPVSYPAGDGVSVPAYISVPPGKEARNLPTIVMPHGGPSARDEWGFDWLAQFLVSQGYAVLQPNYRGSAGYGDAWMAQNGFRGWRTSIGDVTAGAKWLVSQGIADPAKLAILGWSYGGYAALQSGITEPGLYKAVVAIAPVTDLAMVKQEAKGFTSARLVADYIGSGPHVKEGSPLQNAERMSAPVLMFHGDRDANVGVQQSQRMNKALLDAGKWSQLFIFEGLEHSLVDSSARARMLDQIGTFLSTAMN